MIKNSIIGTIAILYLVLLVSSCKKDANQGEIDRGLIESYVIDNNLDGVFSSSGLYYVITQPGATEHPTLNSNVTISYKGYTLNNIEVEDKEYFTNILSELIIGMQEGIQLIGEEGKIKLVVPSALAYGPSGFGDIAPNEVLVFDITLHYFTN